MVKDNEKSSIKENGSGEVPYSQILTWATDENLFRKKKPDEKANFHLGIAFPPEGKNVMDLVQPQGKNDALIVVDAVKVSDEHVRSMRGLNELERARFIFDMRFLLGSQPIQFDMKIAPDGIMDFFSVSKVIFGPLTKAKFMESLETVYRAKLLAVWKIQERFGIEQQYREDSRMWI